MPRIKKRQPTRRGWTEDDRLFLQIGMCLVRGASWDRFFNVPLSDISPEVVAEMRAAWEHFRHEIMSEQETAGHRSWGWWSFDSPEPRDSERTEAEQLRALGLLTESELRILSE